MKGQGFNGLEYKKRVEKTEMLTTLLSIKEFERIREISIDVEYTSHPPPPPPPPFNKIF